MSYQAIVFRILIASPGDVTAERKNIPEIIHAWNATHSEDYGVVLMPVLWETHSTPEMGDRPQAIINKQLVSSCDLLVGAFWTRIGTHTGVAESGSVEEIEEILKAEKPVLLYFSSAPVVPDSIDPDQYDRLKEFKSKCQKKGLTETYNDIPELREKLNRHLTKVVRQLHNQPSFTSLQVEDESREVDSLKVQLENTITRAELDWSTEKKSEPVNIDEGKIIIEQLKDDLLDFRASFEGKADSIALEKITLIISNLKKLYDHQLYMDGGKSYREFWKIGDDMFGSLRDATSTIQYVQKSSSRGLDHEKVKILQLLARYADSGLDKLHDIEISTELDMSMTVARYHLNELEEDEYIHASLNMEDSPQYSILQNGIDFLVKNKLNEND